MPLHSAENRTKFKKFILLFLIKNYVTIFCIFIIKQFSRLFDYILFKYFVKSLYQNRVVLTGPFKGMKYKKAKAAGDILPQLLGTYESELISLINSIRENYYEQIINIGAGDGFYSIGFSNIYINTKVFAYEIDKTIYDYLVENVNYNNKSNQIKCFNSTANEKISNIKSNERILVFSDCEGAEFDIFTENIIKNLKNSDLIIEMHTNTFNETVIEKNLKNTHNIFKLGYGNNGLVDLKSISSIQLNLRDFAKIGRENRNEYHYFLCALSKR